MKKRNIVLLFIILIVGVIGVINTFDTIDNTNIDSNYDNEISGIRGKTYGQIMVVYLEGFNLKVEVYKTKDYDEFPATLWENLDEDNLANDLGAVKVFINNPYSWTVDEASGSITNGTGNRTVTFGEVEAQLISVIEESIFTFQRDEESYVDNVFERQFELVYYEGDLVYELISDSGEVYRMQSVVLGDKEYSEYMEKISDQLTLPEGWSFRSITLKEDTYIDTEGASITLKDNLGNIYQKVD